MFFTILVVFLSLIGLIILHEFGHFVLAKKFGVKVEEFGIGYPPRIIGKKIGQTFYSLNLLPFGAFVKIEDKNGKPSELESAGSFIGKPFWQRILIILGGVVSFWLIAAVLLSIVFGLGAPQAISDDEEVIDPRVQIIAVASNSPAEKAGITVGDIIEKFSISLDRPEAETPSQAAFQFPINKVKEIQELTKEHAGQEVTLTLRRGKEIFEVKLVPRIEPPAGEGAMGVGLARMTTKKYPWFLAPFQGIKATFNLTRQILLGLGQVFQNLVRGRGLPAEAELIGPIGIGSLMVRVFQLGGAYYLNFLAVLAIYLAIFNLLPIPALDGGKLLFLGIEALRGKPVNPKLEQNITNLFFVLLVSLMILVTIRDIARLF